MLKINVTFFHYDMIFSFGLINILFIIETRNGRYTFKSLGVLGLWCSPPYPNCYRGTTCDFNITFLKDPRQFVFVPFYVLCPIFLILLFRVRYFFFCNHLIKYFFIINITSKKPFLDCPIFAHITLVVDSNSLSEKSINNAHFL